MPGDPYRGSKVWKAPSWEIGKPGENPGKVIVHWDLQPTAVFHDRENRRNRQQGALSHLQLARAKVTMGDRAAARKSNQDFLTLWKDADPDVPI